MSFAKRMISSSLMALLLVSVELVSANWDPSTGHLHNYRPSQSWLSQHKSGERCFNDIQVAECAQNTRLSYPNVQVFATFQVNHADDNHHGCPYGTCCAYTSLPSPSDMEADFTNYHSFFWHNLGGISGPGTNPIANPRTGAFGYERSYGKFYEGKPDTTQEQVDHDSHYRGFSLPPAWPSVSYAFAKSEPVQPKCGTAEGENLDPGQSSGSYGNYKPAPASSYQAPPAKLTTSSGSYNS
ncbi:hypothetical protein PCASD_21217 [Puccinia coronata f. sp. avenae]|uniref:Secreted protein n=1 Tax=Puccinia coronata f. sp. avenae TaxID=200324 RepID=A0A2N5SDW0_9BASI|nr:hypothetical protein PCASD_21217 [Puccinia coronata f. sp. avenae]